MYSKKKYYLGPFRLFLLHIGHKQILKAANFITKKTLQVLKTNIQDMIEGCVWDTQWARKFKKVRAKQLLKSNKSKYFFLHEIAFLAGLNFFLVQKSIFDHFWIFKKWNLVKQIFREIDLFDLKSFSDLDFFFWPTVVS